MTVWFALLDNILEIIHTCTYFKLIYFYFLHNMPFTRVKLICILEK